MANNNTYHTLIYKDFLGECNYSTEDNIYYGKIVGIKDLVSYESETLEGINDAFKEAVDDYLQMCAEFKNKEFNYKGFKSVCEYNPEDNSYSGEINIANNKLIYLGYSLEGAEKCFRKVIDDYINALIEENNKNAKEKKKNTRKRNDTITLRQVDFKTDEVIEEVKLDISEKDFDAFRKLFCECGYLDEHPKLFPTYIENHMGVDHGWICPKCKKFVQIG